MKKIKTTKRLNLNRETVLSLTQLRDVAGAGTILVPTKPQASCFILCLPTNNCPPTWDCPLATARC
jgi:hypothetical protein